VLFEKHVLAFGSSIGKAGPHKHLLAIPKLASFAATPRSDNHVLGWLTRSTHGIHPKTAFEDKRSAGSTAAHPFEHGQRSSALSALEKLRTKPTILLSIGLRPQAGAPASRFVSS